MKMFREKFIANVDKEQEQLFLDTGWFRTEKEALDAVKPEVKKEVKKDVDVPKTNTPVEKTDVPVVEASVDSPKIVKKTIKKAGE